MNIVKTQIAKLDYVLTGTIIRKYGPCGKQGCRCLKEKTAWHGPYHIWTRKEERKTITKSLSPSQAAFCRKAIKNMQKLKSLLEKWKLESLQALIDRSAPSRSQRLVGNR